MPTNLSELDAISYFADASVPEHDLPGTTAAWNTARADPEPSTSSARRRSPFGSIAPTAALTQLAGPAGDLVLFVRLQDVAPDGTASDIRNLTAPVRVPDVTKPITVRMPGIVHRFAAGHRVRLVVAASSVNYRGGLTANTVTIRTGSAGQVLSLPVVR